MRARWRLLPHPITTVALIVVWLLLQQSLSLGHLLLGTVLGILIPVYTARFWPEQVILARPGLALRFASTVIWDILTANFSVAKVTLGPAAGVRPGFVRLPLDIRNDFALTVLASTISLTPGTVSAEVTADRSHLIVHYLSCDDEPELVREIKQRYEAPLKELFRC